MGTVILSVLAFIGKLLLGLILFLLLIILLVLFVPIHYEASALKQEETISAKVRVTWLLQFIRFQFFYPEPGKPSLYLLFFDLLNRKSKKQKKTRTKRKKDAQEELPKSGETSAAASEHADSPEDKQELKLQETISKPENPEETAPAREENKESFLQKLQSIPGKINSFKEKILQTENKVEVLQQKALYYWELLKEPDTIALLQKVKPAILKALKQILPRKMHVRATIGLGEPDTTAQVYGIAEIVIVYLNQDIEIIPELNEKKIEGEAFVKGRLYLFVLLWEVLKLLLNKRLWKLIKKCKAGRKK